MAFVTHFRFMAVWLVLWCTLSGPATAHQVRPAVADITIGANAVDLTIRMPLEPLLANLNLQNITNTNESPLSGHYDALRADDPAAIRR